MIIRSLSEAKSVEWGSGVSRRLLLAADGMGFTVADTTARPGTVSKMEYSRHLEAVYCLEGRAELIDSEGRTHVIEPGVMYALDKNDAHTIVADAEKGLRAICVFTPALEGPERHDLDESTFSHY
ncbi:ectoine synthase [Streptomyces sp. PTM05]|uniref:L-ectoine synthase n=1 Tax=Streptantibioticus parmotrematis TaxID=2873249 RepID=A0ABS7QUY9_9ACTN|nr:ectoine synthase [Streptantibioticus parmotrematis]MBY8887021.1 ectoine synthase [Streptantibioticus parmotrematis]